MARGQEITVHVCPHCGKVNQDRHTWAAFCMCQGGVRGGTKEERALIVVMVKARYGPVEPLV